MCTCRHQVMVATIVPLAHHSSPNKWQGARHDAVLTYNFALGH